MLRLPLIQLGYLMQYKGIKGLYPLNNSFLAALHTKEDSISYIYIIDIYNFIELSSYKVERQGVDFVNGGIYIQYADYGGIYIQYADSLGYDLIPFKELLSKRTVRIIGNQRWWTYNIETYMDYIRYLIQLYKTFNTIDETYSIAANISTQGDCEFLMETLHKINQLIKNQEMHYPEGVLSSVKITTN